MHEGLRALQKKPLLKSDEKPSAVQSFSVSLNGMARGESVRKKLGGPAV